MLSHVAALFLSLSALHVTRTHAANLRCYKGSLDNYLTTPLEEPLAVTYSSCIDTSLPTIVYTFGYRGRVGGPATTAVLTAYLNTRKRNVLLLDWENEAKSGALGIALGYTLFAVPNAKKVGEELGNSLVRLAKAGLNTTQIHLVGHSLGAHVMAYAGKRSRERGYVVSRITGLDPARALFEGSFALQSGLDRTCARFVDVVHSDPGGYGAAAAAGTVDFWPNYVGSGGTQPGCPAGDFEMFSAEDLCSHDRAWRYFVEAIAAPTAFPAAAAPSLEGWLARDGQTSDTIYLGDLTNTRARGNYYLTTNPSPLFGRGPSGLRPDDNQARRRRASTLTRLLKYLR
ncbi:phospholipase A1 VesT1.02-like [Ostrinia furnacalis]|uniref:phospholipase A1 VesT1.02-like n=1 Tax=Ostrinia furnacalis TaxID=93504 RepID=UPI00103FA613|nr:phospholipase A1 VesT1.02-like [Ostrinia furnacalis]